MGLFEMTAPPVLLAGGAVISTNPITARPSSGRRFSALAREAPGSFLGTLTLMTGILLLLGVSLGAALVAYLGNWTLYRTLGRRAAVTLVPWWEEAAKLAAAAAVAGTPMLYVHLVFGALEFAYDLWRGRNDAFFLGLLTFAGHGLFGSAAMLTYDTTGSWWGAYAAAGFLHMLYNAGILYYVLPTLGAGIQARR